MPVPFVTFHRDDQPDEVRHATGGTAPAVVAATDDGVVALLDSDALTKCGGSIERLFEALEAELARRGLCWPER